MYDIIFCVITGKWQSMNNVFMYSWNNGKSSRLLSEALGIKRIKHHNSRFRGGPGKTIINWGNSLSRQSFLGSLIINHPLMVAFASNKLIALQKMQAAGVSVPPFTTDKEVVRQWIHEGEGRVKVVGRRLLNSAEGKGIVIIDNFLDVPDCPLYTKYIPKKKEFRVHVVDGKVIDIQQKVRKRDAPGPANFMVRNTANGFVFHRNNLECPGDLEDLAIGAVRSLGLDFGACDIIWNEYHDKCYVLEINTAPGIEGQSVVKYKDALSALCNM
jgi:glutathione synthase/RimK-type ligase-like ATP-grasp enzyme